MDLQVLTPPPVPGAVLPALSFEILLASPTLLDSGFMPWRCCWFPDSQPVSGQVPPDFGTTEPQSCVTVVSAALVCLTVVWAIDRTERKVSPEDPALVISPQAEMFTFEPERVHSSLLVPPACFRQAFHRDFCASLSKPLPFLGTAGGLIGGIACLIIRWAHQGDACEQRKNWVDECSRCEIGDSSLLFQ